MSKKKPQSPRDAARSSEPKAGDDVVSLINERRQIDEWIAALDAKRDQTPPKVFTRVRGDYETRLKAVADKLASHHSSLGSELATLKKKLEKIDGEIEEQQEERAEIELRSHVGELDRSEVDDVFRDVDAELARLASARISIEADLVRVNEFFAAAGGGPAPSSASGQATRRSAGGFDELSFLHSVVGESSAPKASPPKSKTAESERASPTSPDAKPPAPFEATPAPSAVNHAPAAQQAPAAEPVVSKPTVPVATPEPIAAGVSPAPVVERVELKPSVAEPASPIARPSSEGPAQSVAAKPVAPEQPKAEAPKTEPPKSEAPKEQQTSEQEKSEPVKSEPLAVEKETEPFAAAPKRDPRLSIAMQQSSMTIEPEDLESRPSMGVVKANEGPSKLLDGIAAPTAADEKPFAANVASNNPLSLKSASKGDVKTLKCRECGTMNDPTEWYCERCGAELSGL